MRSLQLIFLCILITTFSCKDKTEVIDTTESSSHIKYFGFTLVDTYWDDPTDSETKTNYADEVHSFSNMADILVAFPSQDIKPNLNIFESYDLKAVLHLNEIFFGQDGKVAIHGVVDAASFYFAKPKFSRWLS